MAERLHGGPHAADVAVVVGAEQVDEAVGGAELHDSGDRRRRPRSTSARRWSGAARDPCRRRLLADLRRAEPERAVLPRSVSPRVGQLVEHPGGQAAVAHVALLRRPHVELDAVLARARGAGSPPCGPPRSGRDARSTRPAATRARCAVEILGRGELVLAQVLAGELDRGTRPGSRSPAARADSPTAWRTRASNERASASNCVAGVVDVVLGRHLRAARSQETRERVTDRRRARVDDDERSGGIGGDELEPHALSRLVARRDRTRRRRCRISRSALRAPRGREEDVEEAGAGDLEPRRPRAAAGSAGRSASAIWRGGRLAGASQHHRDVGRVVAVLGSGAALPRRTPRSTATPRRPAPSALLRSVVLSGSSQTQNAARRRRSAP